MDSVLRFEVGRRLLLAALLAICCCCCGRGEEAPWRVPETDLPVAPALEDIETAIADGRFREAAERAGLLVGQLRTAGTLDSLHFTAALSLLAEARWRLNPHDTTIAGLAGTALSMARASHGDDHPEVAKREVTVGIIARDAERGPEARRHLERAVRILRNAPGYEEQLANALHHLARMAMQDGEIDSALALCQQALVIRENLFGSSDRRTAISVVQRAIIYDELGESREAARWYRRALDIHLRTYSRNHPTYAAIANNLALALWNSGEKDQAAELLNEALNIRVKLFGPDHAAVGETALNLSGLMRQSGYYAQAESLVREAIRIDSLACGGDSCREVAEDRSNLGNILREAGDVILGLEELEKALEIRERLLPPTHPDIAQSSVNLGAAYRELGDFAKAATMYRRACVIDSSVFGIDHPHFADDLSHLGVVQLDMHEPAGALSNFTRSADVLRDKRGVGHPDYSMSLANMGEAKRQLGDYEGAREDLREALRLDTLYFGAAHPAVASDFNNLGMVELSAGRADVAREYLDRGWRLRRELLGKSHFLTLESMTQLALALEGAGEREQSLDVAIEAEGSWAEVLREVSGFLPERQALRFAQLRASARDVMFRNLAAQPSVEREERVFDVLVRSRAIVLDEIGRRRRIELSGTDSLSAERSRKLLQSSTRYAALALRGPEDLGTAEYSQALGRAEEALLQAARGLDAVRRDLHLAGPPPDAAAVIRSLPPQAALLSFVRYASGSKGVTSQQVSLRGSPPGKGRAGEHQEYGAFILVKDRPPRFVQLGSAVEIEKLVDEWLAHFTAVAVQHETQEAVEEFKREGQLLCHLLWDPFASEVAGRTMVFVVPEGALHRMTFAALPLQSGRYLMEEGPTLHYLSAERDIVESHAHVPGGRGTLVIADPAFDIRPRPRGLTRSSPTQQGALREYRGGLSNCFSQYESHFQRLPATRAEAEKVERLWHKMWPWWRFGGRGGDVRVLMDDQASEEAVKRGAVGRAILHFATHGFFLPDSCRAREKSSVSAPLENPMLRCGLVLAGANDRGGPDDAEDGVLTAQEVAALDLAGTGLAVLSACETGLGAIQSEEGVLGLGRAFRIAGVSSLLLTMWALPDESAPQWTEAFYRARFERHLPIPVAVREASLASLAARRRTGLSEHPFYWAAFISAGDWR